jgi:CrcB protein
MLSPPVIRIPIAISLGAIAGALSRYYLTIWFAEWLGTAFPYGTFLINLTGCLGMGFFVTFVSDRIPGGISSDLYLLVTTGFLGAYTTFSTYGLDTARLLWSNQLSAASFYWFGSALLGLVCVQLGVFLARLGKG